MPVSMKEIAKEAGVSLSTVSRIFRKQGDAYSAETRKKVQDVAERLRYRPNLLIRGMQDGKTRTVGVMIPVFDPFYAQMVSGIHERLVAAEHLPIVGWGEYWNSPQPGFSELEQIHRMVQRRVDGIIMLPIEDAVTDEYFHEVREQNLPLIAVDREFPLIKTDFVGTDDLVGGRLIARHFFELGHRRVLYVSINRPHSADHLRGTGFEEFMSGHNNVAIVTFAMDREGGNLNELTDLLRRPDRPTAVFAVNDLMAFYVYQAAGRAGLCVPQDLSVVGFANQEFGAFLTPKLTTVEQRPFEVGQKAAELFLERTNEKGDKREPRSIKLPGTLIVRDSTAPCRSI